ncbi:MAG: hypothetical protein DYH03_08215 [Nitrospira sp. NTP1]|nr:hypothetical protein [Nitrospira sp. NTP1]
MRQMFLRSEFVEFIPEHLQDGVLYISQQYHTAIHRCCCGCGEEVVTPLTPTDWSLQIFQGAVTLYPSIGNWSYPCRSHYWIRNGRVVWAGSMTKQQIEYGRALDQRKRDVYFAESNRQKDCRPTASPLQQMERTDQQSGWIDVVRNALKKWLGLH